MSQLLVKTPLMRYNRLRWVMRAISCEQLEEMDLLTIGFQLPPIAIYTFLEKLSLWYSVPNTLPLQSYLFLEKSPSWSRARDWKSRNRQKRFKSSNLFFSATFCKALLFSRVFVILCV